MQAFERLEQDLALWEGVGQLGSVAVVNSGTSALQLALQALELPKGSRVVVPSFTFVACARAVVLAGLEPVFVDCDETGLMDAQLLADWFAAHRRKETGVAALMPVHVYGRRCDMDKLHRVARLLGLKVIEDLAEAHGVQPHPASDAACWSFNRTKVIAGEEGGACAFSEPWRAALVRVLRNQGHPGTDDSWQHVPGGGNYRLANALAVPILRSLYDFALNTELRRRLEAVYDAVCPDAWRRPQRQAPWVYDVRIPGIGKDQQDAALEALAEVKVPARRGFRPLTQLPEFEGCERIGRASGVDVADMLFWEVLCLPLWGISEEAARGAIRTLSEAAQASPRVAPNPIPDPIPQPPAPSR